MIVEHEEQGARGEFSIRNDKRERIAEMTYVLKNGDTIVIDHTHVDEELRGNGVGGKLVDAAAEHAREKGLRLRAVCPYARQKLRDPKYSDVFDA